MDKSKLTENTLQLAIISRIKLYYRPAKLALSTRSGRRKLRFRRSEFSDSDTRHPYYLTVTEAGMPEPGFLKCIGAQWAKARLNCLLMQGSNITYRNQ